jgi:hypothetical protein
MLNPIPRNKEPGDPLSLHYIALFAASPGSKTECHAQTSIYGSVALVNYDFENNNTSAAKSDTAGFVGGVFYNFPIQSRLTAGVDVRGSFGVGSRGGALAAAALRIGFVPERVVLRPYLLLGGGVATSTFKINDITGPAAEGLTAQSTRFTSGGVEFVGGFDVRLSDSSIFGPSN